MKKAIKDILRQSFVYKLLGNHIYRSKGRWFDFKHNVRTAREVELGELKIDCPNAAFGVMYAGTDPTFFRHLLSKWELPFEDFAFVDFGSGKGRAILMAAEQPFKKIIGVEFSPELNQIAQDNIRRYKNPAQKCRQIESICQDASLFSLPPEPTVFYMFNPFGREVFAKVLKNIENSLRENPREIYIVYTYAAHDDLLRQSPLLEEITCDQWHSLYKSV